MSGEKISYVSPKFLRKSAEFLQEVKSYAYRLILEEGAENILDIGCGPGIDTIEIAKRMNSQAQVFGIDWDQGMIHQANIWAFVNGVESITRHIQADAAQLPYEDAFFDVVRSERLFQHLPDGDPKNKAFQEGLRVLKQGGLLITVDTDWTSVTVDFPYPEMERKMVNFLGSQLIINGNIGKQLPGMYQAAGLKDIIVNTIPIHFNEMKFTPLGEYLVQEAEKAKLFTPHELQEWLDILKEKDQQGTFSCSIDMRVVSGRKT